MKVLFYTFRDSYHAFKLLFDTKDELLQFQDWFLRTGKKEFEEFCENERPGRNNQDVG